MRVFFTFGFLLLFFHFSTKAQLGDSIAEALKHKPKISFRFDNRYSFTATTPSKIVAFKIGFEFDEKFKLGGGYNRLRSRITKPVYIENGNITDTVISVLKMGYLSYYAEYVFFKNKRWEFSIPIQLGIGNTHYEYHYGGFRFRNNWSVIINYEANVTGQYKIIKWLGIGAGLGYQLMLKDNPHIDENFNTPVYVIKIKVFVGDIYKSIFPKKIKST